MSNIPSAETPYYDSCPLVFVANMLSKKWIIPIICQLNEHPVMRFGSLQRAIPGITSTMLTQALKELQRQGIISRIQYNEIPLHVEYSLTNAGKDIMISLLELVRWAVKTNPDLTCAESCSGKGCTASSIENLLRQDSLVSSATDEWDQGYLDGMKLLQTSSNKKDALEKIAFLIEYTMERSVECGEELSRLRNMYFIIGNDYSKEFLAPTRPTFVILNQLLEEGRSAGIVTDDLTNKDIIHSINSFRHGLIAYWELSRGSYDIRKANAKIVENFVNGFRKR